MHRQGSWFAGFLVFSILPLAIAGVRIQAHASPRLGSHRGCPHSRAGCFRISRICRRRCPLTIPCSWRNNSVINLRPCFLHDREKKSSRQTK